MIDKANDETQNDGYIHKHIRRTTDVPCCGRLTFFLSLLFLHRFTYLTINIKT